VHIVKRHRQFIDENCTTLLLRANYSNVKTAKKMSIQHVINLRLLCYARSTSRAILVERIILIVSSRQWRYMKSNSRDQCSRLRKGQSQNYEAHVGTETRRMRPNCLKARPRPRSKVESIKVTMTSQA